MTSKPLFLGVDLGTSSLKCGLFDLEGQRAAAARVPYTTQYVDGGAEQHGEHWCEALANGLQIVTSNIAANRIAAIAVGGHAPSPVFVDSNLEPVLPVLPWFDNRSAPHVREIIEHFGRQPANGPERLTAQMAARAMWLRSTLPDRFALVDCILHSGDYLVARLTGQRITTCPAVPEILRAANIPPRLLPETELNFGQRVGGLSPAAARQFGLEPGTQVIAAGLDSFLASIGSGIRQPGDACLSLGSSAGVALVAPSTCSGRFQWCGHQMLSKPVRLGGRSLAWAHDSMSQGSKLPELLMAAAELPPPIRTHCFLADLIDESNHDDQFVCKRISQLAERFDVVEILRVLLDAIFLCQRNTLDELAKEGGQLRTVRSVGAFAACPPISQLQADVLGRAVEVPQTTESGTLGAAMLAAIAMGVCTPQEAPGKMVHINQLYNPRSNVARCYDVLAGDSAQFANAAGR